jgi:uncharacterized spore protein YtfJ
VQAQERAELANELLERIGQTVGQRAQASTIFVEAVEREGVTVIPVARARFGFGGGGGGGTLGEEGQGSGGGGGDSVAVSPIGYIELRDHGSESTGSQRAPHSAQTEIQVTRSALTEQGFDPGD